MKLVFTHSEVASALGMTGEEFDERLDRLVELGFPGPIVGLDDRWAILDVMNWIGRDRRHAMGKPSTTGYSAHTRH